MLDVASTRIDSFLCAACDAPVQLDGAASPVKCRACGRDYVWSDGILVINDDAMVWLVTFKDHTQRVIGLSCLFPYDPEGQLGPAKCAPRPLTDWLDGAVPPSFPPGTKFG